MSHGLEVRINSRLFGYQLTPHTHLLVIVDIDVCLCPFASRYTTSEQNIDLSVGSVSHLGNLEVGDHEADERSCAPDITTLSTDCKMLAFVSILE